MGDPAGENSATMPPFLEIPVDEEDFRYSQSFDPFCEKEMADAKDFFDLYGFCILRNVVSQDECQDTIDDMLALLKEQNPNIDLDDMQSWATALSSFGCPKGVNSLFRPSLLRLRQNPKIINAFAAILGTPELIVSHDRWLLHRPPLSASAPLTKRNIHLDMNPWEYQNDAARLQVMSRLSKLQYSKSDRSYIAENNDVHSSMGQSIQAIINLRDIEERSNGGTILIPGSHKTFASWLKECAGEKTKSGPMQYTLSNSDPLMGLVQHPTLRAGSMIVWDQRVFHGSTPNISHELRAAVPIKAFSAAVLRGDKKRAKERALAIQEQIRNAGFGDELTELGAAAFGLNLS